MTPEIISILVEDLTFSVKFSLNISFTDNFQNLLFTFIISVNFIVIIIREQLLNCREKLDHNISMIQEVFSSGIERGGTKRVATLILIVSFSPGVLHQRPIQAVHFLAESLDFSTLCPNQTHLASCWHVYPPTPDSIEGLIPRAIIWYIGIDPSVLVFQHQD